MENSLYPPEKQIVSHTAFPNGYILSYEKKGMPQYYLLPSNHPHVILMSEMRKIKTKK